MTDAGVPLLEVENLSVTFDNAASPSLDGVSFALAANEILGVVGETGAGKSLLARSIISLLPDGARACGGSIRLEGRDTATLSTAELRQMRGGRVSLIGTDPKALLDPVRTVGAQVADVLRAHRRVSRKAALGHAIDMLAKVGIVDPEARAHAYPHELSGGMAQRVVIAMALVVEPRVILADDATLGLDATIQVQVLDLLLERSRKLGAGVVLITHDLGIVSRYCDRVAVLEQGRLLELSDVGAFLAGPAEPHSRELLAAARVRPAPAQSLAAAAEQGPLLDVRNLEKSFPAQRGRPVVRAVQGVSFAIEKGETLALVGESGSGKTTVGQCIVHLLAADSGEILFDGQDTTRLDEAAFRPIRKRVQMVFQEPYVALNPRWTVADLIAEPLRLIPGMTGAARARRQAELLDLVKLPRRLLSDYPHQLTAGEQKRIGIARALATEPDCVVFDEPTTALDLKVRARIIDLIRELQAGMGLSALFITHDLHSVRSLAHRVAVMERGKIVETGTTEAIFRAPEHPYTRKLLAAELPVGSADATRIEAPYAEVVEA
jgi:ABC-type glutathione transport system ATPase component